MKVILKVYLLSHIAFLSHCAEHLFLEKTSSLTSSADAAKPHSQLSPNLVALIARIKSDNRDRSVIEKELAENPDPNHIFCSDESKKKFLTYSFTPEELKLLSKSSQFKEYYSKNRLPLTVALFHSTVSTEEAPDALYFSSNDTFWTSHGAQIKKWDLLHGLCKEDSTTQPKGIKENTFLVSPAGSQFLIIENETELSMATPTRKEVPTKFVGYAYLTGKKIRSCSFITENTVCITYKDDTAELWDPKEGRCAISNESLPAKALEVSCLVGAFASDKKVIVFKKTMKKKVSAESEESVDEIFQNNATSVYTLPTKSRVTRIAFDRKKLRVTALTSQNEVHAWTLNKDLSQDLKESQEFLLDQLSKNVTPEGIRELHPDGARIALETAQGCMKNQLICVYEIPSRTHLYNIPIVSSAPITKFVFGSTAEYCATLDTKKRVKVWHTPEKLDVLQYLAQVTEQPTENFDLNDLHDFHKRSNDALQDFKKRPAPSAIIRSLTVRL